MNTSQEIYKDANTLLESTNILNLLSETGTVYLVGSYPAKLMWDPDVDLVVVTNTPQVSAIKAFTILAKTNQFQKLEYGDFRNHPMKNRPKSFIVNARKEWKGHHWEIETWFMSKLGDQLEIVNKLKNLSDKDKKSILAKKKHRSLSGKTKKDLSSWKIYQEFIKIPNNPTVGNSKSSVE